MHKVIEKQKKKKKTGSAYRIVRSSTIYTAKFSQKTQKIFHYFQLITEMLHRAQPQDENKKSVHLVSAPEASGKKKNTRLPCRERPIIHKFILR